MHIWDAYSGWRVRTVVAKAKPRGEVSYCFGKDLVNHDNARAIAREDLLHFNARHRASRQRAPNVKTKFFVLLLKELSSLPTQR